MCSSDLRRFAPVFFRKDGIGRFQEERLDGLFIKVRRATFLPAVKLMAALPDGLMVWVLPRYLREPFPHKKRADQTESRLD